MPFSVSGGGLVSPGSSPGILTTTTVDASQGLDFAFEFTTSGMPAYSAASASGNDVLHLTGSYPFPFPLTADNLVAVYLNLDTVTAGELYRGGFYTDSYGDFQSRIEDATFAYYIHGDGNGPVTFNGVTYYPMDSYYPALSASWSTVAESASFASGPANGFVTQWSFVVPEPSALLLLACGAIVLSRRRA